MQTFERKISNDRLHEVLIYNQSTGIFTWNRTLNYNAIESIQAGYFRKDGYVIIEVDGIKYLAHRLAWQYVYGYAPENFLDLINRIRSDNKIQNLREVSPQCNLRNAKTQTNNTSGVRGVGWHPCGKWYARIKISNKTKHIGIYNDFCDAACARLAAEQCVNWSGCDSTSSAYLYVKNNIGCI